MLEPRDKVQARLFGVRCWLIAAVCFLLRCLRVYKLAVRFDYRNNLLYIDEATKISITISRQVCILQSEKIHSPRDQYFTTRFTQSLCSRLFCRFSRFKVFQICKYAKLIQLVVARALRSQYACFWHVLQNRRCRLQDRWSSQFLVLLHQKKRDKRYHFEGDTMRHATSIS